MAPIMPKIKPYEKVRAAMIEAGYNQETLAYAIGMHRSTFNQKINGHGDFTITDCLRMAKILGKTLDELFFTL